MIRKEITALLLGTLISGMAAAQEPTERWYQVELILFLNETGGLASREDWSRDTGEPNMEDAANLEPVPEAAAGLIPFQSLVPEELELAETYAKLQRSAHYQPLLHIGWRQPFAENQEEFIPLRINAPLQPPQKALIPTNAPIEHQLPEHASSAELPANETQPVWSVEQVVEPKPVEGVEGTVRLRVARYLHFDVDLIYRKEQPLLPETSVNTEETPLTQPNNPAPLNPAPGSPGLPFFGGLMADFSGLPTTFFRTFRLTEQRRLRREEIHYFDHPKFGLLVKATAYEPPPPEMTAAPATPVPLPVPVTPTGKATTQPLQ